MTELNLEAASGFVSAAGLQLDEVSGTKVVGHIDLSEEHHTPWGVVHGGVYTTAVESAASIGASTAVADRGEFAVGVHKRNGFPAGAYGWARGRRGCADTAGPGSAVVVGGHHRSGIGQGGGARSGAFAERTAAEVGQSQIPESMLSEMRLSSAVSWARSSSSSPVST